MPTSSVRTSPSWRWVASLSTIENGRGLTQLLMFFPTYTGPLAVGTRVEFGPKESTVSYDESRYPLSLAQGHDGISVGWGASDETQGGTAEVAALGGGRVTLRLVGVRFTRSGGGDPIVIDGTLSGALTSAPCGDGSERAYGGGGASATPLTFP